MTCENDAWCAALIGMVQRSGAKVHKRTTLEDVVVAANHLGISVGELLDAVDVEARFLLATVQ